MFFSKKSPSFFLRLKKKIFSYVFILLLAWIGYQQFWARHYYLITAYCNCPICINVPEYLDGKFATGKLTYWGGIAADPSINFGSKVQLVPIFPKDWAAVWVLLRGKTSFTVEDRGGKIKGKHLDIFFPKSKGGHQAALKWGVRRMRVKVDGKLAT